MRSIEIGFDVTLMATLMKLGENPSEIEEKAKTRVWSLFLV